MIFMWMNDVPIGLLSLTSHEYLNEYMNYVKNDKFEFLKGIMKIMFLKGINYTFIRSKEKNESWNSFKKTKGREKGIIEKQKEAYSLIHN